MSRFVALALLVGLVTAATRVEALPFPNVTSANLSARFDASNINGDGGLTDPGHGNDVDAWTELVGGSTLNHNAPTDGKPTFIARGMGGIGGQDTVRFVSDGDGVGDDLMFNNAMTFNAQTIYAVATMVDNGYTLATLMSRANHQLSIRQTTAVSPQYFTGNADDFINSNGTFTINGNPRWDIPGGFGAAHVLKAARNAPATFSGFRLSDNIRPDRRWNGDVAEVLVFDGPLSGNDAARVNRYLLAKYGIPQVIDETLADTRQVADSPFILGIPRTVAAVNFHYGSTTSGRLHGVAFDNIDLSGPAPPAGPFALTANGGGITLGLNFPFTSDNTPRTQALAATGPDAATLDTVANQFFYVGGNNHPLAQMLLTGLQPSQDYYVQVIGGDAGANWSGDLRVDVNGVRIQDWMGVADANTTTASLFGFFATSDALGQMQLDFTIASGTWAGIGGILLTERIPEPTTVGLLALGGLGLWRRRRRAASR